MQPNIIDMRLGDLRSEAMILYLSRVALRLGRQLEAHRNVSRFARDTPNHVIGAIDNSA